MDFKEIKTLLDAGFTHDDIMKLFTVSTGNAQEEKPTSVQNENPPAPADKSTDTDQKQNPVQNEQPADENKPDSIAELRALFQEMKDSNNQLMQTIQASNLQNNSVNFVGDDLDKKVDDALSSINPVPTRQKGD